MIVTLSLEGELDEIRGIIDLIEGSGISAATIEPPEELDVEAFVMELSPVGQNAVAILAAIQLTDRSTVPIGERTITRGAWQLQCNIATKEEFNGVLGSIGRAWAKVSAEPNPFASQGWDLESDDHLHGLLDPQLMSELIRLLVRQQKD